LLKLRAQLFLMLAICPFVFAQREPVLKQIAAPHPYYYREMYLPQVTTGPSYVSWSADSKSLIYSMAGSLWMQPLNSKTAEELTAGPDTTTSQTAPRTAVGLSTIPTTTMQSSYGRLICTTAAGTS